MISREKLASSAQMLRSNTIDITGDEAANTTTGSIMSQASLSCAWIAFIDACCNPSNGTFRQLLPPVVSASDALK